MKIYLPDEIVAIIGEYSNNREFTILFLNHQSISKSSTDLATSYERFHRIFMLREISNIYHTNRCLSSITIDQEKIGCKEKRSPNSLYCSMCSYILCR